MWWGRVGYCMQQIDPLTSFVIFTQAAAGLLTTRFAPEGRTADYRALIRAEPGFEPRQMPAKRG
jgi:hypothetical protein